MRRFYLTGILGALALAASLAVAPASAQFISQHFGRTFTSTAPSGVNGFACRANGCRVDLGTGASDHLTSDGTSVRAPGTIASDVGSGSNALALATNGARIDLGLGTTDYLYSDGSSVIAGAQVTTPKLYVSPTTIGPCDAASEGRIIFRSGTGGTGSTVRTRYCLCTSDGGASPIYAWQNLATATVGSNVSCNP